MKSESTYVLTLAVLLMSSGAQSGGQERQKPARLALDKLELHNVKVEQVTYLGRDAMRVSDAGPQGLDDAESPSRRHSRKLAFRMAQLKCTSSE